MKLADLKKPDKKRGTVVIQDEIKLKSKAKTEERLRQKELKMQEFEEL